MLWQSPLIRADRTAAQCGAGDRSIHLIGTGARRRLVGQRHGVCPRQRSHVTRVSGWGRWADASRSASLPRRERCGQLTRALHAGAPGGWRGVRVLIGPDKPAGLSDKPVHEALHQSGVGQVALHRFSCQVFVGQPADWAPIRAFVSTVARTACFEPLTRRPRVIPTLDSVLLVAHCDSARPSEVDRGDRFRSLVRRTAGPTHRSRQSVLAGRERLGGGAFPGRILVSDHRDHGGERDQRP